MINGRVKFTKELKATGADCKSEYEKAMRKQCVERDAQSMESGGMGVAAERRWLGCSEGYYVTRTCHRD